MSRTLGLVILLYLLPVNLEGPQYMWSAPTEKPEPPPNPEVTEPDFAGPVAQHRTFAEEAVQLQVFKGRLLLAGSTVGRAHHHKEHAVGQRAVQQAERRWYANGLLILVQKVCCCWPS